jgi:hypothetical protein
VVSPFRKVIRAPAKAMEIRAKKRPIPAHRSQPFCSLNGSLKSENSQIQLHGINRLPANKRARN